MMMTKMMMIMMRRTSMTMMIILMMQEVTITVTMMAVIKFEEFFYKKGYSSRKPCLSSSTINENLHKMSPKLSNIIGGTKRKSEDTGNQLPGRAQKAARSGESNSLLVIIHILANCP